MLFSSFQMIVHRMLVTGPWLTLLGVPVQQPRWSKGNGVVWSAWCHDCGSILLQKECGPTEIWEDNLHTSTISRLEYFFSSVRCLLPYRTADRSTLYLVTKDNLSTPAYLFTYSMEQNLSWEANWCSQLVKKFPTVYETQRFITTFTSACPVLLSWGRSNQSMPPHPTPWRSILRVPLLVGI